MASPSSKTGEISAESSCRRSYFYVGGYYVEDEDGSSIFTGQMYVECLEPVDRNTYPWPIIFIQGAGQTGTNFLNTPDDRKGWASWLLEQGYTIYLIDSICRGRSSYHASAGPTITYTTKLAEERWTACRELGSWSEAHLHSQWPGTGRAGDRIFDAYFASTVPSLKDYATEQRLMQVAGANLLDRIGRPVVLITHSQGGTHGWLWADARPDLSTIGPNKLYGITDIPLTYDPPVDEVKDGVTPLQTEERTAATGKSYVMQQEPARQLTNLKRIPVLLETGEASSHASYDDFTAQFLRQAGVDVTYMSLAVEGIHGNGHLQFLEQNNLEIIERLEKWISTKF